MLASFHNHTVWSDGKTGVRDIYDFAAQSNVDLIGISDHFCVHPDGKSRNWSVDPSQVGEYIANVRSAQKANGPSVIVGLEIDWFADYERILPDLIEPLDLDYRIGSLHHVDEQPFDYCFSPTLDKEELLETWRKYWRLERGLAESGLFDMVAHLDIPKRLGWFPEEELSSEIDQAIDAFKAHGVVVELNTAGYSLPCNEAYASPEILRKCKEREVAITLSADAHQPDRILYEFERGLKLLHSVGFTEVARFREREVYFEPLSEALPSTPNPTKA
ncbi:MAG: histidinol-phosphatase HisJ family protein [Verrucomicrobiota bacterium]